MQPPLQGPRHPAGGKRRGKDGREKWQDAAAKIGGRGEAEITNGLERNEVLTTLSLWRNKIVFVEGAKAIAEALRGNGVLKNLAISGNTKSATRARRQSAALSQSTRC